MTTFKTSSLMETKKNPEGTPPLPGGTILFWPGTVPRFAPVREGGPGTVLSLTVLVIISCFLLFLGIRNTESAGIGSGGPFLLFSGLLLFGFLVIWILIKGILRHRDVTFIIHEKGIRIIPSGFQSSLDTWMAIISRILFWITRKGGQWSAWAPCTPWSSMRSIIIANKRKEIIILGGNWDIRLACNSEVFGSAVSIIQERKPERATVLFKNNPYLT